MNDEIKKTDQEWQQELTPEQFQVMRKHGTEPPGSSPLIENFQSGMYYCAACKNALFSSSTKYDNGCGWPSFDAALPESIGTSPDYKLIMPRTEVHCAKCGGHLGHVFQDDTTQTGQYYCMNGIALDFEPKQ